MKHLKSIFALLTVCILVLSLAACAGQTGSSTPSEAGPSLAEEDSETPQIQEIEEDEETPAREAVTLKLGVVGENNEHWDPVIAALAKENITLEMVKFSDYTLLNQALADGEIDLNSFQHYAFLNNEIADKGLDLAVLGDSIIAPLGLFSSKIDSLDQLQDGDKIAIPNDATNGGRSLKVLEAAGLITVDPEAGYTPQKKDVTENPLNLEFIEVEAAQTPSLLPDVAAAIINGQHAVDAGLNPEEDSIYLESVQEGSDNPYINVIAVRSQDKDNELYQNILAQFQTDEVAEVLTTVYKGAFIPAWK